MDLDLALVLVLVLEDITRIEYSMLSFLLCSKFYRSFFDYKTPFHDSFFSFFIYFHFVLYFVSFYCFQVFPFSTVGGFTQ